MSGGERGNERFFRKSARFLLELRIVDRTFYFFRAWQRSKIPVHCTSQGQMGKVQPQKLLWLNLFLASVGNCWGKRMRLVLRRTGQCSEGERRMSVALDPEPGGTGTRAAVVNNR